MSIIGNPIMAGVSGPAASIFVTGLAQTDTVTATNGSKTLTGKWTQKGAYEETESPDMTSDTAPSGVASASSAYSGHPAYMSFDSSNTSFWMPLQGATAEQTWIQYEFAEEIIPDSVFIGGCCSQSSTAQLGGSSKNAVVKFQGSLDGSSWFDISENFTVNFPSTATGYVDHGTEQLNNIVTRYIRMQYVSTELQNNGVNVSGVGSVCPATIKIYGRKAVEVQGFVIEPIRDLGTWTVTATNGVQTTTQDVLVDVITEYEIEMDYNKLWLYRAGNEFEYVTGGYNAYAYRNWSGGTACTPTLVKNDTSMSGTLHINASSHLERGVISTNSAIKIEGYSKLKFHFVSITTGSAQYTDIGLDVVSQLTDVFMNYVLAEKYLGAGYSASDTTLEVDVSGISADAYVLINFIGWTSCTVDKIWLER